MFLSFFIVFDACLIFVCTLPTPEQHVPAVRVGKPAEAAVETSAERFYDDKLEKFVDRIAEQIVEFNGNHAHPKHAQHAQHHQKGHEKHDTHDKHEKHPPGLHHHHHKVNHHRHDVNFDNESEEMQSDQPQPGQQFGNPQITQQELLLRQRAQDYQTPEDRDRQAMTNSIKEKVMDFITKGNGSKNYGERDRSFYANCTQPKSTEENDDFMKLYFTLPQLEDTIASASLRLYRNNPSNHTTLIDPADVTPCLPRGGRSENSQESEKLYRVTLYYHVKGQKKHKLKKKIGDSVVISESIAYVNLNVLQGVRDLNKGKLFGVMVQIEDQFGTVVKANDFFKGPSCNTVGRPTSKPLPTVFEETHTNHGRVAHPTDIGRKPVQPKLDIKTVQSPPEDDVSGLASLGSSSSASSTRCRHVQVRHSHPGHQQQRPRVPLTQLPPGIGNMNSDQVRLWFERVQEAKNKLSNNNR